MENKRNNITIKLKHIVMIQRATMRIFEAQDQDYPDNRTVANNERAIQYWLNKITFNIEFQREIHNVIEMNNFNAKDLTYKCICDQLRALGYVVDSECQKD